MTTHLTKESQTQFTTIAVLMERMARTGRILVERAEHPDKAMKVVQDSDGSY